MLFFSLFLVIFKNFTGVFLSEPHLHLKSNVVKPQKLQPGEGTAAPGSAMAAGVTL